VSSSPQNSVLKSRPQGTPPGWVDAAPPFSGGGGAPWVELTRTENDIEAHLLSGRLSEGGIECRRVKDRSAPGAWLYGGSNPWAPVTILVSRLDLESARIVLAEISWAQPAVDPSSPSSSIDSRSWALTWWAAAIVLGLVFTSVALARTADSLDSCELPLVCATQGAEQ
jgi:Putative prokaryotic signal transducing protein